MAKRKYTRMGENPSGYECANKKCNWQGLEEEQCIVDERGGWKTQACPKCGGVEFFGLLNYDKEART